MDKANPPFLIFRNNKAAVCRFDIFCAQFKCFSCSILLKNKETEHKALFPFWWCGKSCFLFCRTGKYKTSFYTLSIMFFSAAHLIRNCLSCGVIERLLYPWACTMQFPDSCKVTSERSGVFAFRRNKIWQMSLCNVADIAFYTMIERHAFFSQVFRTRRNDNTIIPFFIGKIFYLLYTRLKVFAFLNRLYLIDLQGNNIMFRFEILWILSLIFP